MSISRSIFRFLPVCLSLLVLFLFSSLSSSPLSSSARAADGSDWERLSKDQVVIRQSQKVAHALPSVEAKILVRRPIGKVWSVVADPVKLTQEENKVKKVKVLSRSGNQQNVALTVSMTRLLPPFSYVLLQELTPPTLLQFRRVSGSFQDLRGAWRLSSADSGRKTILSYTLQLDPGPLVPKSLLLGAVKSDLPNFMRNARAAVENNT